MIPSTNTLLTLASVRFTTVALSLVLLPAAAYCLDDQLLQYVKGAHKSSRDAIQFCSCEVKFDIKTMSEKKDYTGGCSGTYTYSLNAIRVSIKDDDENVEYTWSNGVRESLVQKSGVEGSRMAAVRASLGTRHNHRCDAWARGLLVVSKPQSLQAYPFEQLCDIASRVKECRKEILSGKDYIVVTLQFDKGKDYSQDTDLDIYFDKSVNYLISKVVQHPSSSQNLTVQEEVTRFSEVIPGLYFPVEVKGSTKIRGQGYTSENSTRLTPKNVNKPISPAFFKIHFPHGIYMTDSISDTSYRIDQNGNKISSSAPLGKIPPPPAGTKYADTAPQGETTQERGSYLYLVPIAFLMLLVASLFYIALRRYRSRGESDQPA